MKEQNKNIRIEIMVNTTENKASKLLDDLVDYIEETLEFDCGYEIIDADTDEILNI